MASSTVNTTHVNFTAGSTLLLCILTIMVCGALLVSRPTTGRLSDPVGPHGNIRNMTAKEAEDTYGPVNSDAGHETKQGIFFNRRCRSACTQRSYSRNVSWSQPAQVVYTQRYASYCQPCSQASATYSNPVQPQNCNQGGSCPAPAIVNTPRQPAQPSQPTQPVTPAVNVDVPKITPPGQLRIIPSL